MNFHLRPYNQYILNIVTNIYLGLDFDENIHYMHMILNKGECLPEHFSNAKNVYITVVRGTLSATLNEQETHEYQAGTVLKVPVHTKMNLKNVSEETLEFIVVKAPAPNC